MLAGIGLSGSGAEGFCRSWAASPEDNKKATDHVTGKPSSRTCGQSYPSSYHEMLLLRLLYAQLHRPAPFGEDVAALEPLVGRN